MKQIYLSLIACLLAFVASAQGKPVPYTSILYGDADWTNLDNNYDGSTWADNTDMQANLLQNSVGKKGKVYTYNSSNAANDWLFSPQISLEGGRQYKISFFMNRGTYNEKIALYASRDKKCNSILSSAPLERWTGRGSSTEDMNRAVIFTPEESGDYYISLYCSSDADQGYVAVTDFSIAENVTVAGPVTDLTCAPGADDAIEATLAWTLPAVDSFGAPLPAEVVFEEISVARDGETVASLEGSATSWTDTEATGLTGGTHIYEVKVRLNGQYSAGASVTSPVIGGGPLFAIPYDAGIASMTSEDFSSLWLKVKGAGSGASDRDWEVVEDYYSDNYIRYYGGASWSGTKADEWLISPRINFVTPGQYKVTARIDYNPTSGSGEYQLSILLGAGSETGGYTREIASESTLGNGLILEGVVYMDQAAKQNIAFHLVSPNCNTAFRLYSLTVEEMIVKPAQITDLAVAAEGTDKVRLTWTWPSKDNTGADLLAITKAEIYRDDTLVGTLTENLTPGQVASFTDTPGSEGVFTYKVLVYAGDNVAEGEPMTVTSPWIGEETREVPYSVAFYSEDPTKMMWTGVNANDDTYRWVIDKTARLNLGDNGDPTPVDDYLLSPYISLTPGFYAVTYKIKGGGNAAEFAVGLVSDKEQTAPTFSPLGTIHGGSSYSFSTQTLTVRVDSELKAAVALHAGGEISENYSSVEIEEFSIEPVHVFPDAPENLSVEAAADDALQATLRWTNPVTSSAQGVVPLITKAVISRKPYGQDADFEEVGEVTDGLTAGEEGAWTDTSIPESGVYVYSVLLHGPDGAGEDELYVRYSAEVISGRIGAPYAVPFTTANGFIIPEWTVIQDNPVRTWEFAADSGCAWMTAYDFDPNDWLISPRILLEDGKAYRITAESTMDVIDENQETVSWDLHLGYGFTSEDMSLPLATVVTSVREPSGPQSDSFIVIARNSEPEEIPSLRAEESAVTVPAGALTVGIHVNARGYVKIHGIHIEETEWSGIGEVTETDAEGLLAGARSVKVFNLQGVPVMANARACSVDTLGLAPGLYILLVEKDGVSEAIKVAVR